MTMRSEFLKPVVFASKTSKPLDRPGNCPLFLYSLVNSSTALPSMGVTGSGPSFTSRRSAMPEDFALRLVQQVVAAVAVWLEAGVRNALAGANELSLGRSLRTMRA